MNGQNISEHGSVLFGQREINFSIIRSSKRKTLAIAVDPMDGITLTAPSDVPVKRLEIAVKDKGRWIVQHLKDHAEIETPLPERQFISGESFRYLGRQLLLKVVEEVDIIAPFCKVAGRYFLVSIPKFLEESERKTAVRSSLSDWYQKHAMSRLSERVKIFSPKLNVDVCKVLVRDQQKRWGSCDKHGNLRFNWRLIMAPTPLVDYVVAHELCHLKIKHHSTKFWKLLGTILPDYEIRKERLRKEGGLYDF